MDLIKPKFEILEQQSGIDGIYKMIELSGRTCYHSQDKITEDSAKKFVDRMIESEHFSMLEHGTVYLDVTGEDIIECQRFYCKNPYSKVYKNTLENGWPQPHLYVTTNYRVIVENKRENDLKYLCNPTEYHEKRICIKFISDIHFYKDCTRHRVFSWAIESSRYCVTGDTRLTFKNYHTNYSIKELYEDRIAKNKLKRVLIRVLNPDTGVFEYTTIKNVFFNGIKKVYNLKTRLGYSLKCTKDHRIYTSNGWKELAKLNIGDQIYVNGTRENEEVLYRNYDWLYNQYITLNKTVKQIADEFGFKTDVLRKWLFRYQISRPKQEDALYKDYDWLYEQNITLNKTFVEIAKEFNFNVNTVKKWARKLNIPHKGTGYFNVGRIPWNKGLTEKNDERVAIQAKALREFHHDKNHPDKILKVDTSTYQKYMKDACEICGKTTSLEVHHIDEDRTNNFPENLLTVCESCHRRVHNKNLLILHSDTITDIEELDEEEVYDLEIEDFHNYVANGIIVHNCNYLKERFGSSVSFAIPVWLKENEESEFKEDLKTVESIYFKWLKKGWQPQQAAYFLIQGTKAEIVMTGFASDFKHFFDLRSEIAKTGKAHPTVVELVEPLRQEFIKRRLV